MRLVIQRVSEASVEVAGECVGRIDVGFLVLVGVEQGDTLADATYLANKTLGLRVFSDEQGKMNLDLSQVGGGVLAISQFTLLGDCRKGRRPSFVDAAEGELGERLYDAYCQAVAEGGVRVERGRFGADMDVRLVNQGPVTMLLDSRKRF